MSQSSTASVPVRLFPDRHQDVHSEKRGGKPGASSTTALRRDYTFIVSESSIFVQKRNERQLTRPFADIRWLS
jgi:hypothetical protein